jgi:hypothetical protein
MPARFPLLPILVVAVAGACSSVTVTSTITVEQACGELATARCTLRSNCSRPDGATGVGSSVLELYGDMTTCLARETLACTNGLSAPQTGNDPATVQMCVQAFMTYSCVDFFDNLPPVVCTPVGPRANGAPCTFNSQCQSGTCTGTRNGVCGTCGDPPGLGEDCLASNCARGARCLSASNTCAAVGSSNEACDDTHPCDRGLSCVVVDQASAGTCETAGTRVGVACGGTMPGCDGTRGLSCEGAAGAKTCQPVAFAGATCGQLADGSRGACVAGTCITPDGAEMGTCVPFAPDGDPCDTAAGPGCMLPARCVTDGDSTAGTCVVPTASVCAGG